METTDPFLQVQADVISTLQSSRPLFSSYLRIRSLAKSPTNPELKQARSELESTLTELTADLDDLVESVRAIEQDPYRFGLELDEVQRRRKLVEDVGAEIEQMHTELAQAVSAAPAEMPNPTEFEAALDEEEGGGRGGEDYYASLEQQRQSEIMHEQDEQLDGVFRTVGNLRQQASDMGRELEDQAVMIDEVDTLADRVGGKLSNGMARIRHIVRKNEGKEHSHAHAHTQTYAVYNACYGHASGLRWVVRQCCGNKGESQIQKLTFSSPLP
ncbi:t-SNARE [Penicillium canariense]|uniref:t-SNARE affecting a late Golgi compartment protein 1 n=1 Tax=Penicillium canariense TaxID=189055 RepID=A0A9W9LUB3_9EURO|nr:t-SNARE [Penicillium canariense]KAJ5176886.1 t-SNARE [Penicillium canariense]